MALSSDRTARSASTSLSLKLVMGPSSASSPELPPLSCSLCQGQTWSGRGNGMWRSHIQEDARDVVTAPEELRGCRVSLSGGAHAVVVVFTDEHRGQVPQLGEVEGLSHLTLVSGTVSVEAEG